MVPGVAGILNGMNFLNKELEPTHIIAKVLASKNSQKNPSDPLDPLKNLLDSKIRGKPMAPPFAKDIGQGTPSEQLSPVLLQKDGAPPSPVPMRLMSPDELKKGKGFVSLLILFISLKYNVSISELR